MTAKLARRHPSCGWCQGPMPAGKRAHAAYCSVSHGVMASRRRRRDATAVESPNPTILAGGPHPAATGVPA